MPNPTSTIELHTCYTFQTLNGPVDVEVRRLTDDDGDPIYLGRVNSCPTGQQFLNSVGFLWYGGGYIDFGWLGASFGIATPADVAVVDTFNVFDYEFTGLLINPTPAGFGDFLATLDDDDIARVKECVFS